MKRYESYYEQRRIEELWNFFLNNYNIFIGKAFEEISREFLIKENTVGDLPFKFDTIGNWWVTSIDAYNKKIEGKEKLKRNGCIVFDLDDFNGIY